MINYRVGNVVALKKGHPCGTNAWIIRRTGTEIKLECAGCGREVWMDRPTFHKSLRKIQNKEGKFVSILHYTGEDE